jgi:hypothetical protein
MTQLHKRFTDEQIRAILRGYCENRITCQEVLGILQIRRRRFFRLLKSFRSDPQTFSLHYRRETPKRISAKADSSIQRELQRERELVENPQLPIFGYNYSAVRDRLDKKNIRVSLPTIIRRAKEMGCYQPRRKEKAHDREVVTSAIGALIQHDASHHLWSPYASEKWVLITSLDDFSRKLLFAQFFEAESTWAHILAAQSVCTRYGVPLRYYVDNLRVFRFIQQRDSVWRKHILQTDEALPQWKQVMQLLGVEVVYALSPQAKGKIERPYRWLQDRIVRTCALEGIHSLEDGRSVLQDEVNRYNERQVHSTTKEIPDIRFEESRREGNTFFRPFACPPPYASARDIFCLRETRTLNGYHRISYQGHQIEVPNVPVYEDVQLNIVPNPDRDILGVRIWWDRRIVHSLDIPLNGKEVHF